MQKNQPKYSTAELMRFWGATDELSNLFAEYLAKSQYGSKSVAKLYDSYSSRVSHLEASKILDLLLQLTYFRDNTKLEASDSKLSPDAEKRFMTVLNDLAQSMQKIAKERDSKNKDSKEYETFSAALAYCQGSILERLQALEETKHPAFSVYNEKVNELKTILEKPGASLEKRP